MFFPKNYSDLQTMMACRLMRKYVSISNEQFEELVSGFLTGTVLQVNAAVGGKVVVTRKNGNKQSTVELPGAKTILEKSYDIKKC